MASSDLPADSREAGAPTDSLNSREGWYLLNVYWLSSQNERRVRTGELAAALEVSPASVTEMAAKLAEASLLEHEKYGGVELTPFGASIAEALAWRQCVVASFFDHTLSYAVDGYTAYQIGYTIPGDGMARLKERIDHPCVDACRRISQDYDECLVGAYVEG